eukprot:Pompholyxophrys_punicea_v1_NODE_710_length_1410_cov_10.714391.p1 type:complete len:126 gc:universal NODE_710_length_1410_cov_10.714391:765-388(-)
MGVDFEKGEISALKDQFPDSELIGCLFHFKQRLRRRLIQLGLDEGLVGKAMAKNCIDLLTVVEERHIEATIAYIRGELIEETENEEIWNSFWNYFEKVWMQDYALQLWNIWLQKILVLFVAQTLL